MNAQPPTMTTICPQRLISQGPSAGSFYRAGAQLNLPVYLDQKVQATLAALASAKGVDFSALIHDLLKKDIELIEMAR
jgi:hypothetical protein